MPPCFFLNDGVWGQQAAERHQPGAAFAWETATFDFGGQKGELALAVEGGNTTDEVASTSDEGGPVGSSSLV
ncbi:uncharacterized protein ColSpa_10831 [Colletotrichum spaethianum]|uniref:Uncharacterized protein n=1 Tax=Colletotrichum spaethianum TaxID=700344 RepID=A0AA37PEJ8_9PEZI|nr:uncharacterized protein ColSpa_10831 [Colletotrichum spaethianum]GKT50650.1 hypothetical protein ColSpa_10831 [Colletotrichum spaethianum]